MSKDESSFHFLSQEDFNARTEDILPDTWTQVQKVTSFFSSIIKSSGPDTFAPTSVVFNPAKEIVGVFTCRPFTDKDDLYQALSELLFFPVTIGSQLFIVAADSNVRDHTTGDKLYDALNITFISPDFCYIYTLPYTISEDNDVLFQYENSNMSSVAKEDSDGKLSEAGDMVELFFIFSHVENKGPFTFDEVLAYYDDNNFAYEIINRDNLHSNKGSHLMFRG